MSEIWADAVNGSDSNPGTQTAPVKTLTKAGSLLTQALNKLWLIPSGIYTDALNISHHRSVNAETYGNGKAVIQAASGPFCTSVRDHAVLTLTNIAVKPGYAGQNCCDSGQHSVYDFVNCDFGDPTIQAGSIVISTDYGVVNFSGTSNNLLGGGQSFVVMNNAVLNIGDSVWIILPSAGLAFSNGFYYGTTNAILRMQGAIHAGPGGNVNTYAAPYIISNGSKLFKPAQYSIPGTGYGAPICDAYSYAA